MAFPKQLGAASSTHSQLSCWAASSARFPLNSWPCSVIVRMLLSDSGHSSPTPKCLPVSSQPGAQWLLGFEEGSCFPVPSQSAFPHPPTFGAGWSPSMGSWSPSMGSWSPSMESAGLLFDCFLTSFRLVAFWGWLSESCSQGDTWRIPENGENMAAGSVRAH